MSRIKYAIDPVNNIVDVMSTLRGFNILQRQGAHKQSRDGDVMLRPAVGDTSE